MARLYTLVQLSKEVRLSLRTLTRYVQKGALPPADHRGPATLYDEAYRTRLKAVVRLRAQGLRLDAIAAKLDGATPAEIAHHAGGPKPPVEAPPAVWGPAVGTTERWERTCLHAGLELHLASNADETARRMADAIRAMFGPRPPGTEPGRRDGSGS